MTLEKDWYAHAVLRELYGLIQLFFFRDHLTVGNDIALIGAQSEFRELTEDFASTAMAAGAPQLSSYLREISFSPITQLDQQYLSEPLDMLHNALATHLPGSRHQPHYLEQVRIPDSIEELVIAVGATIGVGDELLLAQAINERARSVNGVKLKVSSRQSSMWQRVGDVCEPIEDPPRGAIDYLDSLTEAERAKTGFLYLDFLESDPSSQPYVGPSGLAFAARWYMGSYYGDVSSLTDLKRYFLRYPEGLPESRWLECLWLTGQIFPTINKPTEQQTTKRAGNGRRRLALQVLTAKQELMLPPDFYAAVFHQLEERLPDAVDIAIMMAPSPRSREIGRQIGNRLAQVIGNKRVIITEDLRIVQVIDFLGESDLLFGPDTFTNHAAALLNLPQVVMVRPEHLPWITPGMPTLIAEALRDPRDLAKRCADRLYVMLSLGDRDSPSGLTDAADRWHVNAVTLRDAVARYAINRELSDPEVLRPAVDEIIDLYKTHRHAVAGLLNTRFGDDLPEFCFARPLDYRNPDERVRAVARFYQSIGISDMNGVFEIMKS